LFHSDHDITLGDKTLLSKPSLFKPYTPFTLLDLYSKQNGKQLVVSCKQNKDSDPNSVQNLQIEVQDQKTKRITQKANVTCPEKKKGRIAAALIILKEIFGSSKKWFELMNEVAETVKHNRISRGAGEKPVLRKIESMSENSKFQDLAKRRVS